MLKKYMILTVAWTVFSVFMAIFCLPDGKPSVPCTGVIIANLYFAAYLRSHDEQEKESAKEERD